MPIFSYSAVAPDGRVITGNLEGESMDEVEEWLATRNLTPIEIVLGRPEKEGTSSILAKLNERFSTVTLEDKILLCRQITTLFGAGIPVIQVFDTLTKQLKNPRLKTIIETVKRDVEAGDGLSLAFSRHKKVFDDLFINLVRVGEESGTLEESFEYLSNLYENEKEVRERIKAATRYPKIVITALFLAISFLMTFVVPKFVTIFQNNRIELPLPTRILVAISGFFTHYYWVILLIIVAIYALYKWSMGHSRPREVRDRILLRLPIFGELYLKIYLARFCRVFSVLVRSGVEIIQTIDLSMGALQNVVLRRAMEEIRDEVRNGVGLDEAMGKHTVFTPLVLQMVAAGVESGQIDSLMGKVAEYYESEADYTIKNLSTLIEPILLLFLGIIVGFIALAIFLPMWSMMDVVRGGH